MQSEKDQLQQQLNEATEKGAGPKATRLALQFVGGMIPVAGGVFSGISDLWETREREQFQNVTAAWLKLQEEEIREIARTLQEVLYSLDLEDEKINARLHSQEYLAIIKKCFRDWNAAESITKREFIKNLLMNTAINDLIPDDLARLFIDWIDHYSDSHFKVLKEIFKHKTIGISRREIWKNLNGKNHKENSAEADLFKLIIHDLTVGRIIRQYRETDDNGNFLKQTYKKNSSQTLSSAFDDEKIYVLTELGKQFVDYIIV